MKNEKDYYFTFSPIVSDFAVRMFKGNYRQKQKLFNSYTSDNINKTNHFNHFNHFNHNHRKKGGACGI